MFELMTVKKHRVIMTGLDISVFSKVVKSGESSVKFTSTAPKQGSATKITVVMNGFWISFLLSKLDTES